MALPSLLSKQHCTTFAPYVTEHHKDVAPLFQAVIATITGIGSPKPHAAAAVDKTGCL